MPQNKILALAQRKKMRPDEIALLLPEVFRRTLNQEGEGGRSDVLSALLAVMVELQFEDEEILEHLDLFFNPETVPRKNASSFLPFLARWVDLDWLLPERGEYEAGLDCLRDLILAAPRLANIRGTRQGLEAFLETATGLPGYRVEEDPDEPFHITIYCPPISEKMRPLVERIARAETPAYVKWNLIPDEHAAPVNRRQEVHHGRTRKNL